MNDVPRSVLFDDIYFSPDDGRAETAHVFIQGNDLYKRFKEKDYFTICESGFGTGLNFLMAWEAFIHARGDSGSLHYISFEKYPLSRTDIERYLQGMCAPDIFLSYVSAYPEIPAGRHDIQFTKTIRLTLICGDLNQTLPALDCEIDAWFLDGFAPSKNPEMWSQILFENMARLSNAGTSFATFTAAGFVRRGLKDAGFEVEKIRGFGHKREMLRGIYHGG